MTYPIATFNYTSAYEPTKWDGRWHGTSWSMTHKGVWFYVSGRGHWCHGQASLWSARGYMEMR